MHITVLLCYSTSIMNVLPVWWRLFMHRTINFHHHISRIFAIGNSTYSICADAVASSEYMFLQNTCYWHVYKYWQNSTSSFLSTSVPKWCFRYSIYQTVAWVFL